MVALTFDDGPDARWTPRLLDALERAGARATFFPIAPRAAAHPELVARILAEGHTVGLHCHEHVRHSERDADWIRADTERALGELRGVAVTPALWRTPWGDRSGCTASVAAEHSLRLVDWTVDTHDWRGDSADDMVRACGSDLAPGVIVLAHDGIGPGARRAGAGETVAFVERAADIAARTGLTLGALR
ncbi:MAG: polysaccharide deacetylase family protein [Solirubrobacteraceae bacterium]